VPGARVLRIDADSTRRKGSAGAVLQRACGRGGHPGRHADDRQGHDFQRVSLVGVLNADTALFSHDFRASERLFAQLMQVSGRAGRAGLPGEVLVQTRYPRHALYALGRHDYVGFANSTLGERRDAHLPPFVYQALLRAEGRTLDAALGFLQAAAALPGLPGAERVTVYDAVPMTIVKVANVHRAQLLLESVALGAAACAARMAAAAARVEGRAAVEHRGRSARHLSAARAAASRSHAMALSRPPARARAPRASTPPSVQPASATRRAPQSRRRRPNGTDQENTDPPTTGNPRLQPPKWLIILTI
jgi:primosomal protein N'